MYQRLVQWTAKVVVGEVEDRTATVGRLVAYNKTGVLPVLLQEHIQQG